ncbi:MAG: signal protein [Desulfobulbaceae bacterium]|nr:MAG: signal protein [Desulfobulbaceae bacterium]
MQNTHQIFAEECPPEIIQVGRQPILDRDKKVYGYELLYRHKDLGPAEGHEGNLTTAHTILSSFVEFGLRRLAGNRRVFINLTRSFFTDITPLPLDKKRIVLEVLEDIKPDQEVITGIRALHASGYSVALDDYAFSPQWDVLLPYCTMVKVDVLAIDLESFQARIARLKERGLTLIAEKVENHQTYQIAKRLGFDLFQGFFFAKPEVLSTKRLQSNEILLIRLLGRLNDPNCTLAEVVDLVRQDPKLSFKLLRFINSAAIGLQRQINSIREAVVYVGLHRLRLWATLFIMAGLNPAAREVISTGLVRAQLCHLVTEELQSGEPESSYSVGLLSVLDAILNVPMKEVVKDLPFPAEMIDALVYRNGTYGANLKLAMAMEQGHVSDVPIANLLPLSKLKVMYLEALLKTEEIRKQLS